MSIDRYWREKAWWLLRRMSDVTLSRPGFANHELGWGGYKRAGGTIAYAYPRCLLHGPSKIPEVGTLYPALGVFSLYRCACGQMGLLLSSHRLRLRSWRIVGGSHHEPPLLANIVAICARLLAWPEELFWIVSQGFEL